MVRLLPPQGGRLARVRAFGRPVLLAQGDVHTLLIDRPLRDADAKLVTKFTRPQVFGDGDLRAMVVTVICPARASSGSGR